MSRSRIATPVRQHERHPRQLACPDLDGALPEIDVERRFHIPFQNAVVLQIISQRTVPVSGLPFALVDSLVPGDAGIIRKHPDKFQQPLRLLLRCPAFDQRGDCDRSRIDERVERLPGSTSSSFKIELKSSPVGSLPTFAKTPASPLSKSASRSETPSTRSAS